MTGNDLFDDDGWAELARELNVGDKKQPTAEPEPTPDEEPDSGGDSPYHAAVSSSFGRDDREDVPVADADEVYAEAAKVAGFDETDDSDEGDDDTEASGEESTSGEEGEPGQKKRRRRRRRRRKKGGAEGEASEGEGAAGGEVEESSGEAGEDDGAEVLVEVGAGSPGLSTEDTTPEMAREIISNWNVPSWDEIIAGLYRPDR